MLVSAIASWAGWSVQPVKPSIVVVDGVQQIDLIADGTPIVARSILTTEGLYWAISSMVRNFINFPPLGIVLVAMFGIGVAERVGLFSAAMRQLAVVVPPRALTPTVLFLGVMSNVASDAGYVVLPPLAAALYAAAGRSPLVGIVTAFAGVAAGFSANLLPSAGDAMVAGLTEKAAQVLEPAYVVSVLCNYYFLAASAIILPLVGWLVTARVIEPRLMRRSPEEGGPPARGVGASFDAVARAERLSPGEVRALSAAGVAFLAVLAIVAALILIPGMPLYGKVLGADGQPTAQDRWAQAVVPIILVGFLAPGIAYGMVTGALRKQKDVADAFIHAMVTMAPIVALAFFAAQFIEHLKYSRLDTMIAFGGGSILADLGLPPKVLLLGIVIFTMFVNLFVGSMSAKWTMLAPILVPMMMVAGLSPEVTQVAYRVGDSVTNVVTPLNSYMLIILVAMQRWHKGAGVGSLIALMLPYTVAFTIAWSIMLVIWIYFGLPIGVDAPLVYPAPVAVTP
jgi:aminobenzoyl-glutamate transport protein